MPKISAVDAEAMCFLPSLISAFFLLLLLAELGSFCNAAALESDQEQRHQSCYQYMLFICRERETEREYLFLLVNLLN